jgi:hypothetical protein
MRYSSGVSEISHECAKFATERLIKGSREDRRTAKKNTAVRGEGSVLRGLSSRLGMSRYLREEVFENSLRMPGKAYFLAEGRSRGEKRPDVLKLDEAIRTVGCL